MFIFLVAIIAIVIALRELVRHPWLLIPVILVFVLFYGVMPAYDPSNARFGDLVPEESAPEAAPAVTVRRALPVNDPTPVRRALPVN